MAGHQDDGHANRELKIGILTGEYLLCLFYTLLSSCQVLIFVVGYIIYISAF